MEGRAPEPKPIAVVVGELWELLRAYAKQETIDPLRSIGHFLAWGVAGAFSLAIGVFFLALGGLRALQTEADTPWSGSLAYVIVLVGLAAVSVVAVVQTTKGQARHEERP